MNKNLFALLFVSFMATSASAMDFNNYDMTSTGEKIIKVADKVVEVVKNDPDASQKITEFLKSIWIFASRTVQY